METLLYFQKIGGVLSSEAAKVETANGYWETVKH